MLRGSWGLCNPPAPQIQRNAATATFPPLSQTHSTVRGLTQESLQLKP